MKEEVNMISKYKKSIKVINICPRQNMKRLEECELSQRALNALRNEGFIYLEEVARTEGHQLLRIPMFGRKSFNEIKEILAINGLHLGTGDGKHFLVVNTTNTFEVIPGKTYSRDELQEFLARNNIEFNVIPKDIRDAERVNGVREIV